MLGRSELDRAAHLRGDQKALDALWADPRALVLVPTRELAKQVRFDLLSMGKERRRYILAVYGGTPYGFVYLDICARYGENWTTTLSHEVLELLADPNAAMTVAGPRPKGGKPTLRRIK